MQVCRYVPTPKWPRSMETRVIVQVGEREKQCTIISRKNFICVGRILFAYTTEKVKSDLGSHLMSPITMLLIVGRAETRTTSGCDNEGRRDVRRGIITY